MFSDLIARLTGPKPVPLPEMDGRLALAGLLVRVAKSDGKYSVQEIQRIDRILTHSFSLNPVAAARLRADAERLEIALPKDGRFAGAVAERVDDSERERVLAALFQVAQADGTEHPAELAYVHRAAELLGLDDAAEARARGAASGKTVIPHLTSKG